jgi:hypothetical protein
MIFVSTFHGKFTFEYCSVKKVSRFCRRRESVPQRGLITETPGRLGSFSGSGGSARRCSRHFLTKGED